MMHEVNRAVLKSGGIYVYRVWPWRYVAVLGRTASFTVSCNKGGIFPWGKCLEGTLYREGFVRSP